MPTAGPTCRLAPLVEIAFDQDPNLRKDLLIQEICARHVGLLLVEENLHPLLTPLKKNRPFHPRAPLIVNLCGSPSQGGFNHLRCALVESPRRETTGANAACLKLLQKPHLWTPKPLLPTPEDFDPETLLNLLPLPALTLKPSFYQLTFGGEPIQASFLQGKIKTVFQGGNWRLPKEINPADVDLLQNALESLCLKSRCPQERLYGSLLALKPPLTKTPSSKKSAPGLKLLHTELNPSLHPESPWTQSLKPTRLSYKTLLRLALTLEKWRRTKLPA